MKNTYKKVKKKWGFYHINNRKQWDGMSLQPFGSYYYKKGYVADLTKWKNNVPHGICIEIIKKY